MVWRRVRISSFLEERQDRIHPEQANKLGLSRLEKIDFSGKVYLNENKTTRTRMILVKKGDLVISGINIEKGAVAVYQGEEDVLATIHYSSYKFNTDEIDIEYFKWFLKSKAFKYVVNSQIKGGIKTELKPKKFLKLQIDLPDLNTQIEIRNKINSIDSEINELINIQYKNEKLLKKLRQVILTLAIQGKIVPQDPKDESAIILLEKIKSEKEGLIKLKKIKKEKNLSSISENEIPFKLPNCWAWVRLGDIAYSISDGVHYAPKYTLKGVPSISAKDIFNHKINLDNCNYVDMEEYLSQKEKFMLRKNSLLVTKSGSIGRTAIFDGSFDLYIVESVGVINLNDSFIDPKYIRYILDEIFTEITYKGEHVRGLGVKHLTLTSLKRIMISLPPLTEQKRIVQKVDKLMELCDELEQRIKENQKNSELLIKVILKEAFENEA